MLSEAVTFAAGPRRNPFLDRLRAGELTLMLGIRSSRTTDVVRLARACGQHAILVDLEHSAMPVDVAVQLCASAGDLGMMPMVRVPERDYGIIGRLLDGGARGILAPRVETADEAALVCQASRFPPHGGRSQVAMLPQLEMRPTPASVSNPLIDAQTVVLIMIESPVGVANADEIAGLAGVDMLAIGANDLTAELGVPGRYDDPRVREAVATVAEACRRHGKLLMLGGIGDFSVLESLVPLGVCPLQLTGMDTDLLFGALQARAETIGTWHASLVGSAADGQETS